MPEMRVSRYPSNQLPHWLKRARVAGLLAERQEAAKAAEEPLDVARYVSRRSMRRAIRKMLVCVAVAFSMGSGTAGGNDGPLQPEVTVAHPKARSVPIWDEYTGRFEPLQQVEVRPRVSGAVDKIHFVDGQFVQEGDLLYVIDPRPFEIAVDMAKADVARAQAQVAVTSTDATRAEHLIQTNAITLREADQRKTNLSVAKAQQLGAEATLRNAELNLEWTRVRAPISGRVSNHRVDVGNLVQGGQTGATLLTTIVTLDPIHFTFDASEADYIRYARLASTGEQPSSREFKKPVMVRLADEPDWSHSHAGVMDFIDNRIDARAGTIRGRAIFENKNLFLLPGTFGRLRLFVGEINALLIPDATIVSDQASRVVLTVGSDNRVVQKSVTLGAMYQGLRVVVNGLTESDRVVVAGVANPFVRPGAVVKPMEGMIAVSADAASN
jgi:membrane fusion protein, multidrug efflux system